MSEKSLRRTRMEQNPEHSPSVSTKPSIVRIVGTGDGIVMRIGDRSGHWQDIVRVLSDHLAKAEGFFQGERVAIEIGSRLLTANDMQQIADVLASYTVAIWAVRTSNPETYRMVQEIGLTAEWPEGSDEKNSTATAKRLPAQWEVHLGQSTQPLPTAKPVEEFHSPQAIADAIADQVTATEKALETPALRKPSPAAPVVPIQTPAEREEAEAAEEIIESEVILAPPYIYHGTLRSGQVFRHAGTVMVVGDVNPGAEVISGGDIFIWGKLRGIVHAGAMGNERSIVCAIDFEPIQLRIAGFIAMSPKAVSNEPGRWFWRQGAVEKPEVARVMGKQIVVDVWDRE